MKKKIVVFLVLMLVFSSISVYADDNSAEEVVFIEELPEISYKEYIRNIADINHITEAEAIRIDRLELDNYKNYLADSIEDGSIFEILKLQGIEDEYKNMSKAELKDKLLSGSTFYYTISGTRTYSKNSDFSASVNAVVSMYSEGSFRQINSLQGSVFSRRESGIYRYDWIELNTWDDPKGGRYPTIELTIGAEGYFEVRTNVSGGASLDIPGFSISGSIGQDDIYQSELMSIRKTYVLYP